MALFLLFIYFSWVYTNRYITGSLTYNGLVGEYSGGGFYQDLPTDLEGSKNVLKELKENLWINRGTRAILIDFTVYNANLNLFCVAK